MCIPCAFLLACLVPGWWEGTGVCLPCFSAETSLPFTSSLPHSVPFDSDSSFLPTCTSPSPTVLSLPCFLAYALQRLLLTSLPLNKWRGIFFGRQGQVWFVCVTWFPMHCQPAHHLAFHSFSTPGCAYHTHLPPLPFLYHHLPCIACVPTTFPACTFYH